MFSKVVVGSNFFPKKEMTDDENNGNIENKYRGYKEMSSILADQ